MADLGVHIGAIARFFYGEPNKHLSRSLDLRFGNNGSLSVDTVNGRWYDHEAAEGGSVLDLLKREGITEPGKWLTEHGFGEDPKGNRLNGSRPAETRKVLEAAFDYADEEGQLLFQSVRFKVVDQDGNPVLNSAGKAKKAFSQRRPDGDGWAPSVKGVRLVLYRLPDLLDALANERTVYIVEGEKKADALIALGFSATCSPMGAGKWRDEYAQTLKSADVVIMPDNDDAGEKHAEQIAASLVGVADRVRVLRLPNLPHKGDVVDWIAAGGTVQDLDRLTEAAKGPGETGSLAYGAVWYADVDTALADPEWLVDDMLTEGDLSLVYGMSQSGKSFFATHVALAITRGVPVFGRKVRRGGVVYIAGEGKKGFKLRLKAYRQHFGVDDALPFLLVPTALDLCARDGDTEGFIESLKAAAPVFKQMGVDIALVVVDTLAAMSPGANENSSEHMSLFLKNCQNIRDITGGNCMIVHHRGVAAERPRGWTGLYANCDNVIEVICDETRNRTARILKLKDGEDGASIGFRLQAVEISTRASDNKAITSCVVVPSESPSTRQAAKRASLPPQTRVAYDALLSALIARGQRAPVALELPIGTRVVDFRYWRDAFRSRSFEGTDADDAANVAAVKKALTRAGTQLLARGAIGRSTPWVWIAAGVDGFLGGGDNGDIRGHSENVPGDLSHHNEENQEDRL